MQANLITKTDFDAKLSSLNRKITQNETMPLKIKYLMLAVLLKKQNITLNIAEIDTKVWNLVEIVKNIQKGGKELAPLLLEM